MADRQLHASLHHAYLRETFTDSGSHRPGFLVSGRGSKDFLEVYGLLKASQCHGTHVGTKFPGGPVNLN